MAVSRCLACRSASLYVAPAGTLWVGFGASGGLARIDNRAVTSFVASDGVDSTGAVASILEDQAGIVWASTASGPVSPGQITAGSGWAPASGLPDEGAVNAFIDRGGGLWVSTSDGLYRRERTTDGHFEQVEPSFDPCAR